MTKRARLCVAAAMAVALSIGGTARLSARDDARQMDPRRAAGIPLPVADLPVGTVSVLVIRGTFSNYLPNVPVQFVVNGTPQTATTDAAGRAQVGGIANGARVKLVAVVEGERLESQEFVMAGSGLRLLLVATDKSAPAAAPAPSASPSSPSVEPAPPSATAPFAGGQMPDPKLVSGVPLPVADVAVGTVSIRVIRDSFANNVADVPVEFFVNGQPRTVKTDADGRAQVANLPNGTRVKATVVVDGQRVESQDITVSGSGIRVVLVAGDGSRAAAEAVKGTVALGSGTRVVAQFSDERLNVFYAMEIVNAASTPVDIGGPFIVDLPSEARGASILEGSTPRAAALGARIAVTGPFAPGTTRVDVGFELPYSTSTKTFQQRFPVEMQQVLVLVPKEGGLGFSSAQAPQKQDVNSQGVPVTIAMGPALAAGQPLVVEIHGLPAHARWPRYVALSLAGAIATLGIWAAVLGPRRRSA